MENTSRIKLTGSDKAFTVFVYVFLLIALIIVAYPLIYIISASISDPFAVNSGQMLLFPKGITFAGYQTIFENQALWRGYALSRPDFVGKNLFTKMMMLTMFVGGGLIPTYILVTSLEIGNSVWALVLPNAASVYNIIVTRTFFQSTIPIEIEEAAIMDGRLISDDFSLSSYLYLNQSWLLWHYFMVWGIGINISTL